MKKAGIIGLGLIGGSIARALRQYSGFTEIVACGRNPEPLAAAMRDGTITQAVQSPEKAFAGCDILFICTPVDRIAEYAQKLAPIVGENCILTDVGSVKQSVCEALADVKNICFIGGHPMAGSEKAGYASSSADLFKNAAYLLTPYPHTPASKLEYIKKLVIEIGAKPIIMTAAEHDQTVAAISHMPHVTASALVNVAAQKDLRQNFRTLAAGGFKDITRIASADPTLWQSIVFENQKEILKMLTVLEHEIGFFKEILKNNDRDGVWQFFQQAKEYRDGI